MKPPATITNKKPKAQFIDRLPKYLFPFFLIVLHYLFRLAADKMSFIFVGPALASASAGLVISLATFRPPGGLVDIPDEIQKVLARGDFTIEPNNAHKYRVWCIIIAAILTLAWAYTVILVMNEIPSVLNFCGIVVETGFIIGIICYSIGLGLSEYREYYL